MERTRYEAAPHGDTPENAYEQNYALLLGMAWTRFGGAQQPDAIAIAPDRGAPGMSRWLPCKMPACIDEVCDGKLVSQRANRCVPCLSQLASVGIVDPFADHRGRPLLEHLEDFRRFLAAKGSCDEHVKKTLSQANAIVENHQKQIASAAEELPQRRN